MSGAFIAYSWSFSQGIYSLKAAAWGLQLPRCIHRAAHSVWLPSSPAARADKVTTTLTHAHTTHTHKCTHNTHRYAFSIFPLTNFVLLLQLLLTLGVFAARRATAPPGSVFPAWHAPTARAGAPLAGLYCLNVIFSLLSLKGEQNVM